MYKYKMDFFLRLSLSTFFVLVNLTGYTSSYAQCPRKYHGIDAHTACAPTSANLLDSGITEEEKQIIVNAHNKYRTMVHPPACAMFKLSWDEELSMLAKKWAENCVFNHDPNYQRRVPGKYNVGQNLAHGYLSWEAAMKAWYDEYKDYNYGKLRHKGVVGHYTQMVWATTSRIGCYMANCKNMRRFYVCDYAPGGNFAADPPYERCSKGGYLNDCRGKACYNSGVLDPQTCQCKCEKYKFIYGPQCSMNCTGTRDSHFCNMRKSLCRIYSNIPDSCPWLCNICPYAGYEDIKYHVTPSTNQHATQKDEQGVKDIRYHTTPSTNQHSTQKDEQEVEVNLSPHPDIPESTFIELMKFANTSVEFNDIMYRQIDGISMGSPLGPSLSNIFMGFWEKKIMSDPNRPAVHFRYVDDTFCLFNGEDAGNSLQSSRWLLLLPFIYLLSLQFY